MDKVMGQSIRMRPRSFVFVLLLIFLLHIGWNAYKILSSAHTNAAIRPTDVAIVLGAAVWRDQPSPVYAARIEYALDLLETGMVQHIIFTGGLGGGDELAESVAGARYAVNHGADPEKLRCESTSNTTWGNLQAAAHIMQQNQWQSTTIVSDPLHLYRATLMANDLGIAAQSGPTPYTRYRTLGSKLQFFLRELFFVHQYRLQRLLPLPADTPRIAGNSLCE